MTADEARRSKLGITPSMSWAAWQANFSPRAQTQRLSREKTSYRGREETSSKHRNVPLSSIEMGLHKDPVVRPNSSHIHLAHAVSWSPMTSQDNIILSIYNDQARHVCSPRLAVRDPSRTRALLTGLSKISSSAVCGSPGLLNIDEVSLRMERTTLSSTPHWIERR